MNKPSLKVLLVVVTMAVSTLMSANDYYIRHLNRDNGLSHSSVFDVFQDSEGYVWISTKNGLNRFDGYNFVVFRKDTEGLPANVFNCVREDSEKHLWIASDSGLFMYDMKSGVFSKVNVDSSGETFDRLTHRLFFDGQQGLIILSEGRVFRRNPTNGEITPFPKEAPAQEAISGVYAEVGSNIVYYSTAEGVVRSYDLISQKERTITTGKYGFFFLTKYGKGKLLGGTHEDGLYVIDCREGVVKPLPLDSEYVGNIYVRVITSISNGDIWIGTQAGIYILKQDGSIKHLSHEEDNLNSISDDAVYSIFEDRDHGLWIGSYFGGVDYIPSIDNKFNVFLPSSKTNFFPARTLRDIIQDEYGRLWVASEYNGIIHFDPSTGSSVCYDEEAPVDRRLIHNNVQSLAMHGGCLWAGLFNRGIDVINLKTGTVCQHYDMYSEHPLPSNFVFSLYNDNHGRLWIGFSHGVWTYSDESHVFVQLKDFPNVLVTDIMEDSHGMVWFATFERGLFRYDPSTEELFNYSHDDNNPESLPWNRVSCIFEHSNGEVWVGTEGGLCRYNLSTDNFTSVTSTDGLPSEIVYCIVEDGDRRLWITTDNGLVLFDPMSMAVNAIYTTADGLPDNQFNYNSGTLASDGSIWLGVISGLVNFDPKRMDDKDRVTYPVKITGFEIMGNINDQGASDALTPSARFDSIRLKHKQSSIWMTFSSMDYEDLKDAGHGLYYYKLDGVDNIWRVTRGGLPVTYNNISAGRHIFRVKYIPGNGRPESGETTLAITVLRPPLFSIVAITIYILLASLLAFYLLRMVLKRKQEASARELKDMEQRQKEEMYRSKIDFFTNLAHEIRTPISLIKLPLDYIISEKRPEAEVRENLVSIQKNTDRLLEQVNQLLDFRKMESSQLALHPSLCNVNTIIRNVLDRFHQAANQKQVHIDFTEGETTLLANVDGEAMTKVVSNLLTNALKHARTYIRVFLTKERNNLLLRVSNDGNPIPNEYKEKIFEAFFQIKNDINDNQPGTGIGLSYISHLVKLHEGEIYLDTDAVDTSFVVRIPMKEFRVIGDNQTDENVSKALSVESLYDIACHETGPCVLVVEDNDELRAMLQKYLTEKYTILTASNGREAMNLIENNVVDLIVTDLMMPVMDGIELCNQIKTSESYCHLPVIMLTAKAALNDKIEGLNSGAEAYMEKPFSMDHLFAQIDSILENRNRVYRLFRQTPNLDLKPLAVNQMDQLFLDKLRESVLRNIDNEDYDINGLSSDMNMSRSSLHRKIKGLTGDTPGEFIRIIRLKRAAELLKEGGYRVNEVCMMVGLKSFSYFSKSFQKMFGVLPKDFAKQN